MPGRRRTGSRPSSTSMSRAVYSPSPPPRAAERDEVRARPAARRSAGSGRSNRSWLLAAGFLAVLAMSLDRLPLACLVSADLAAAFLPPDRLRSASLPSDSSSFIDFRLRSGSAGAVRANHLESQRLCHGQGRIVITGLVLRAVRRTASRRTAG